MWRLKLLRLKRAILLLASSAVMFGQIGQIPGQYPGQYPPGQPPRGQSPGGPGFPGRSSKKSSSEKDPAAIPRTISGVIRQVEEKSIEIEASDTRILTIHLSDATTKPKDLRQGDGVDVVVTQDKDGQYQASSIKFNRDVARTITPSDPTRPTVAIAPAEESAEPPSTVVAGKGPKYDDDDSGPPKIKRGVPNQVAKARREAEAAPIPTMVVVEKKPEPAIPAANRQALVEKARTAADAFTQGLPNYVCTQVTTRYNSETKAPSWNVVDVISMDLVFENGKESYKDFKINGKATKKSPEESGAWSRGEFGTILADLFTPTVADFKYVQEATITRLPVSVYDFKVERSRSAWKIEVPGQYIRPAYKGSVWIEKQGAHVMRIEMQAKDIPEEFPRVTVETAVDYEFISLGTPEKFLLPVRAEVLSCGRGSSECQRNVIEFRNYHKFAGESTIKFNNQ